MRRAGREGIGDTMRNTPEENAALVRRFLTDVVAGGDTAAADIFLTEDSTDHDLVFGERQGRDAVTTLSWRILAGADVGVEIDEVVATHERVAVRATVTGTHTEPLLELAPTGVSFEIDSAWFCRLRDGRIAEIRSLPDGLGLLRQLGALPEQPATRPHSTQDEHPE